MENLGWGLQMTVLGMGLVFALLVLLWLLLTLILKLDKGAAPAEVEEETSSTETEEESAEPVAADAGVHTVGGMAADLVAAIMVAAMAHQKTLRGEAAPVMRTAQPGSQPSRWAAAGRVRQTNTWTPRGK